MTTRYGKYTTGESKRALAIQAFPGLILPASAGAYSLAQQLVVDRRLAWRNSPVALRKPQVIPPLATHRGPWSAGKQHHMLFASETSDEILRQRRGGASGAVGPADCPKKHI